MPYCIVENGNVIAGPIERPANWNGINDFHLLPDEDVAQYGWIPAVVEGFDYDVNFQVRSKPVYNVQAGLVSVTYTVSDLPIDEVREKKLDELAAYRYKVETGGIVIGETKILTDRESQAQITGAYNAAKNGLITSLNFKGRPNWVTLSAAEMIAIGEAVYAHVQNCFNVEKAHYDAIMALQTSKEVAEYNINSGW